jgi:hypothetical protein
MPMRQSVFKTSFGFSSLALAGCSRRRWTWRATLHNCRIRCDLLRPIAARCRRDLLIVGSAAGPSGALGIRLLDLVVAGLQRRLGS